MLEDLYKKATSNRDLGYKGAGNWTVDTPFAGIRLPELGITEALGGQKQSVTDAQNRGNSYLTGGTAEKIVNSVKSASNTLSSNKNSNDSNNSKDNTAPEMKDTGGDSGGGDKLTTDDVNKIFKDVGGGTAGKYLETGDYQKIFDEYAKGSRDSAKDISGALEDKAKDRAEREYKTILQALGVQKGEVNKLGTQQKENINKETEFGKQTLTADEQTQIKNIESEREDWKKEYIQTKDDLATAWREMSLEVQRIARGAGRDSSSWAATQETDVLKDFNKGLRVLAEKNQGALKSFSDAIVETARYYTQKREQLDFQAAQAKQDIDTWVRQQVQSIQSQEGMALNDKLSKIDEAVTQGMQLQYNVEQSISAQALNLGVTLASIQAEYRNAVATAALGKADDAAKAIDKANAVTKDLTDLVNSGSVGLIPQEDGTVKLVGKNPATGEDYEATVASVTATSILDSIAQDRAKDQYGALYGGAIPQAKIDEERASLYGQYGLQTPGASTPTETNQNFLQKIFQ